MLGATNYHETIDDLRRDLMKSSATHQAQVDVIMAIDEPSDQEKITLVSAAMAANYAYTLAAVLGVAQRSLGPDIATPLAFEVDEILTNGDFDDLNADVTNQQKDAPAIGTRPVGAWSSLPGDAP